MLQLLPWSTSSPPCSCWDDRQNKKTELHCFWSARWSTVTKNTQLTKSIDLPTCPVAVTWRLTLASRRKLSRICALFIAFSGKRAWKAIGDRLQRPHYLSRVDHQRKIRSRRQRTDIRKYSFVNWTIQDWNQLPAEMLGTLPCKLNTLKKRARKAIIEVS